MGGQRETTASMEASCKDPPRAVAAPLGMEGKLGILYVCGEQTDGKMVVADGLLGRKVRGICGAYDRFVALADAWELEWPSINKEQGSALLENQLVAGGLQDVKVHHVAVGKNHRVALSLDGQLFSWGRPGTELPSRELGHQHGVTATVTATGVPYRVVAAPELFFTQVSCGKHHSAAVTDTGDVYTWGRNFEGQLGLVFRTLPKEVNAVLHGICAWPKYVGFFLGKARVVSVCCGDTFTASLLADGSVYLLGGRSLRPASSAPEKSAHPSSSTLHLILEKGSRGEPFVAIACGFNHVLAVTGAGEIFSWGFNTFGQLGHGGKTGRGEADVKGGKAIASAVSCDGSVKWAKVFAGGSYSAAITTECQLYTWGNGSHGKLGHGKSSVTPRSQDCEFVPRRVDYLQRTVVGAVVCADRNLFAFAPTHISDVAPLCGEHSGGYELRICGSGFWPSDNVTVRFVPLSDGRLLRGTLGTFRGATGEVVCQVPKFRLPGEYAVEVSMNGKHFTSNGRVFTVFKRPQVAAVSVYDARFAGGEEVTLALCGSLPEICRRPVVRFSRCRIDGDSGQLVSMTNADPAVTAVGVFDERPEVVDEAEETEHDPSDVSHRLLRLTVPALPNNGEGIAPYTLEISYDGGLMFAPVCVDPALVKHSDGDGDEEEEPSVDHFSHSRRHEELQPLLPHVIWAHDAQLARVCPNSFLSTDLPQTITLELVNLLPPEVAQLSVTIVHSPSSSGKGETDPNATAALTIERVEGNFLTCTIPPLTAWLGTAPAVPNPKAASLPAKWWKAYSKTGLASQLRVSMNSGRTFLPAQLQLGGRSSSTAAQMFGMVAPGRLLSLFPSVGMVPGGTQVSVVGDFFHFDTQDAAVKLRWRENSVVVPAVCLRPEESAGVGEPDAATRRVVFRTPPLPFPADSATVAAMAEGMMLGTREEVDIWVSLDGEHFTDAGLGFVYCAVPEVGAITPQEAEPGTKMSLAVDKAIATSAACVRLEAADSNVSLVVPVEIDEAAHTAEFVLPELPLSADAMVHLALSLNGQEFTQSSTRDATLEPNGGSLSFRYIRRLT
ncbi:putative E3 ubiquitin-protein ligase herc3 [Phytophthora pseudosyringae]|uniref:Putative E3 ubiquitin-protein ligase herc3 n=1 Tax=Phytophthora pseudosyringae TaxID=221518 RepID=A0A8T1VDM9_9STRA|nr:putative E3 ubiquitin-protein ligase herc3 [Phytophthora pseudosyringae]